MSASSASEAATVNGQYPDPLQVQVLDGSGMAGPAPDRQLPDQHGGQWCGGDAPAAGDQVSATTDQDGQAHSPPLVANPTPCWFTATASINGGATLVVFTLDNHAETTTISARVPTTQVATVQRRYPKPLRAWWWTATGSCWKARPSPSSSSSGERGGSRRSSPAARRRARRRMPPWDCGPPPLVANQTAGAFTATAKADAGSSSAATFRLRNLPPRLLAARTAQTATVGRRYPLPLQVRVIDNRGRPVSGVTIGFQLGQAAGGAAAGEAGRASSPAARRRARPRTAAGWPSRRRWSRTTPPAGSPPPPASPEQQPGQLPPAQPAPQAARRPNGETATVGRRYPLPLQVRVIDNRGRPVSGVTIGFQLGQGAGGAAAGGAGASFVTGGTQASATTNSRGLAVTPPLVANDTPGGFTATAGFAGSSSPVSFHLRNLSARLLASWAASHEHRRQPRPLPLRARVVDDRGRPIAGITVTFQTVAGTSGAAVTFPRRRKPGDGDHRHRRRRASPRPWLPTRPPAG